MRPTSTIMPSARLVAIVPILAAGAATALLLHPGVPAIVGRSMAGFSVTARKGAEAAAHFGVFAILARLFSARSRPPRLTVLLLVAVLAEAAQWWVPTRGLETNDALCNVAGVLAGRFFRFRKTTIAATLSIDPIRPLGADDRP